MAKVQPSKPKEHVVRFVEKSPSDKLLELMGRHSPVIRKSLLARDIGCSPTAMTRYFRQLDDGTIDEHTWAQIGGVLHERYGIDASSVRPVQRQATATVDVSLLGELEHFASPAALGALIKILETRDPIARDVVLVVARDRLQRSR